MNQESSQQTRFRRPLGMAVTAYKAILGLNPDWTVERRR